MKYFSCISQYANFSFDCGQLSVSSLLMNFAPAPPAPTATELARGGGGGGAKLSIHSLNLCHVYITYIDTSNIYATLPTSHDCSECYIILYWCTAKGQKTTYTESNFTFQLQTSIPRVQVAKQQFLTVTW